jgi:hypothetical protein
MELERVQVSSLRGILGNDAELVISCVKKLAM